MQRKRTKTDFDQINLTCFEWFKQMRAANARISGPILQERAKNIAVKLGVTDFQASNGWLEKFRVRFGIQFKALCGEANEIKDDDVEQFKKRFATLVEGFDQKDWFNADELGLFFKLLPDKSLVLKNEQCNTGKMSKERLTVLLCASATGEKLNPLVIGKSQKPRAFKNLKIVDLPVVWRSNKTAWMTATIFEEWVRSVENQMRKANRRILLTIDNCPAHVNVKGLKYVKLCFLPPNMTARIQPLDQGIIKNFKSFYRNNVLKKVVATLEHIQTNNSSASDISKTINVLDAVSWIDNAWNSVTSQCIQRCFVKAGFSLQTPIETCDVELVVNVDEALGSLSVEKFAEYVSADDSVAVCCEANDEAILNALMGEECGQIDSDDNLEEAEERPKIEDALKSIDTLKKFSLTQLSSIFIDVTSIENKVNQFILSKPTKQTSILQFLKEN